MTQTPSRSLSSPAPTPGDLLDAEQEVRLARTVEAGVLAAELLIDSARLSTGAVTATRAELERLVLDGELARRRFVEANTGLVGLVARQAAARAGGLDLADLQQEGCLGLITAVERFDHRRGVRFATYALYWIRAYVGAASATRLGELNLSVGRASDLRRIRGAAEALGQELGRPASALEIAEAVGRTPSWTEELLSTRPVMSLDGLPPAEVAALLGPVAIAEPADEPQRQRLAARLLAELPELEREVLSLRMGFGSGRPDRAEPMSYAAVGRRLQMSVTRVRRIEQLGIASLQAVCPVSAREHLSA